MKSPKLTSPQGRRLAFAFVALFLAAGCSGPEDPVYTAPDRAPGVRAPLTASCDAMDPMRCLLPWPSSSFTAADPQSETGIRVAVDPGSLLGGDDPSFANIADGFSRVTPIVAGFEALVAPIPTSADGSGPVRLILAQPDHPAFGSPVPLRFDVTHATSGENESLVTGYPLAPLEPGADYVAVVLDDIPVQSGGAPAPSRAALVALGREPARSPEEAKLAGYHAPTRAALAKAGIDPARVIRVWDFTTRSQKDATMRLRAMRDAATEAVMKGEVSVSIDSVTTPADPSIALIVEGQLKGLPSFASPDLDKGLTLDAERMPVPTGARAAPFRVMIPAGSGDYRFLMFGHGMGGSHRDALFDHDLAVNATGKVNIEFHGWTEAEVIETFVNFTRLFIGTHHASALLMQAVADGEAIQKAMLGPLGDALAAPMIGGQQNPAAGRRPTFDIPAWAGGSLGGTMGLVFASSAKETYAGVLNVPGAAWTHFTPKSSVFNLISALLQSPYLGNLNVLHAVAMSQGIWDEIDGAVWADELEGRGSVFLLQESIGDPVLPNPGSEMAAVVTGAAQVGAVLSPIVGVAPAEAAGVPTAITQYRVPETDELDIHGFAANDTPAGEAAREQIRSFLLSVYDKNPTITVPSGCKGGSCDFTSSQ
jgi:hypothetical protein